MEKSGASRERLAMPSTAMGMAEPAKGSADLHVCTHVLSLSLSTLQKIRLQRA